MQIIDILNESTMLLGLSDEQQILSYTTPESESASLENKNIASLFNLIKFSIRELCTNYIPVTISENVVITNKSYPLSSFNNFIRIQNVYKNEQLIKFKIINRNLILEEDGEYTVNYATYPTINSLFDDIDFLQDFSPDAIVFGLCAYFSLAHGMFDEFNTFHEKYISRAESLKDVKIFELPNRRWE